MSPERTNLILASDIPHGERNVLVLNSLNVEAFRQHTYDQSLQNTSNDEQAHQ